MSQLCGGRNSRSHAGLSPASHPLPTLPSPLATSPLPSPLRSFSPPPITTTWSKSASPFFHASSATAPSRLKQISSRALPPTAGGAASARLSRCTMSKSVVPSAKWPCTSPFSVVHACANQGARRLFSSPESQPERSVSEHEACREVQSPVTAGWLDKISILRPPYCSLRLKRCCEPFSNPCSLDRSPPAALRRSLVTPRSCANAQPGPPHSSADSTFGRRIASHPDASADTLSVERSSHASWPAFIAAGGKPNLGALLRTKRTGDAVLSKSVQ